MLNIFRNKVAINATWIIISKLVQSVFAFIITILTARYLGPSNYGLLSYASSIVAFVLPIVFLGFNNTLVHEISCNPQSEGEILGTAIRLSFISAIICLIGVIAFGIVSNIGDEVAIKVIVLYSFVLIFQVFDLMQYWFQAKLLSKYSSIVTLIAYAIVAIYKIILLVLSKNVIWFAVSNLLDFFLIAIMLLFIYKKIGGQKLSFNLYKGKKMFDRSKHYIITGLMIAVFSQTDKIMLKAMIDEAATGYYSAAISLASVSSFVYIAIINSFRPVIFNSQDSKIAFEIHLVRLYSIIIYLSIFQSIIMSLFAKLFVNMIYGPDYLSSINVLRVIVWYTTFSYLGSIRNIWMLAKDKQRYLWIINMSGATLNIFLNLVLIPHIGPLGAAIASVVTQFFSNFVMGFVLKPIRENNRLLILSLNPRYLCDLFRKRI